ASSRKCALHGVACDHVLQMPITGRPSNWSWGMPWFFIQERCTSPSRSCRPNHSVLRRRRLDWDGFLLMMLPVVFESGLDRGAGVRGRALLVPKLTQHDHRLRRAENASTLSSPAPSSGIHAVTRAPVFWSNTCTIA